MDNPVEILSRELARIIACTWPPSLMVRFRRAFLLDFLPTWCSSPRDPDASHNGKAHDFETNTKASVSPHTNANAREQSLADILSNTNEHTVRTCVLQLSPCAIARLASIVTEALPHWPYTLEILHTLCHSPEFRKALLKDNPRLLDTILTKASRSRSDLEEYRDICVQLLSDPLPEAVVLPESTKIFFLQIFHEAVKRPTVETFKPVYLCLKGACKGILRYLSPEAQTSIDEELRKVLKSKLTFENSALMLFCMGIVVLSEPKQPGHQQQWKTRSGQRIFGNPEDQARTINLTSLGLYGVLKGESGSSVADSIEEMKIATRTIQCIEPSVRHEWSDSNPPFKSSLARIVDKVTRPGLLPEIQLEALTFYATLVGEDGLKAEMVSSYEAVLLKLIGVCASTDTVKDALQLSLPLYASHIRKSTISQLFSEILDTTMMSTETYKMDNALALLEVLIEVTPECAAFCSQTSLALTSKKLQGTVESFLKVTVEDADVPKEIPKERTLRNLRRKLHAAAISMLLTVTVANPSSETGLPQNVVLQLIKKQQGLVQVKKPHDHIIHANPGAHVSLFEQACTQSTGPSQEDLRDRVTLVLNQQVSYQRESVLRSVYEFCHDLERRCNDVEEPLRREKEKAKGLAEEVVRLSEELADLREECENGREYLRGCEMERDQFSDKNGVLEENLKCLQKELKEAHEKAGEALRRAQEEHEAANSKLRSTISAQEETMMSLQGCLKELEEQVRAREVTLAEESRQKETLQAACDDLTTQVQTLTDDLAQERKTTADQTEELQKLRAAFGDLGSRFENAKKEMEAVSEQKDALESRHQELLRSSEQALKDLETKHLCSMEAAAVRSKEEQGRLQAQLEGVKAERQRAQQVYEDARKDLQVAREMARSLEEKVQELVEDLVEKEDALEELQSRIDQVLNVASVGPPVPRARRQAKPRTSTQNSTRHLPRKSQAAPRSPVHAGASAQGITNTAMEVVANASFSSSETSDREGSTPKRPRPRRAFKVPDMHTPYSNKTELVHKSTSRNSHQLKRQALRTVSPNRRHTSVGFAAMGGEQAHGQDAAEKMRETMDYEGRPPSSFDAEGYLGSTPFTPGRFECSTQKPAEGEAMEEQTTEL